MKERDVTASTNPVFYNYAFDNAAMTATSRSTLRGLSSSFVSAQTSMYDSNNILCVRIFLLFLCGGCMLVMYVQKWRHSTE